MTDQRAADPQPTMHIGAVAERTGLSLRTLRHYDEVGLVRPSGRSDGGFRLYTDDDVERLLLVRRMKPLGFALEEMTDLLDVADRLAARADTPPSAPAEPTAPGEPATADLRARLAAYVQAAEERREELARKLAWADELIELLRSR
ncbi:MerR family transcriptional regulator [Cellulosimicrobium sp. CUA-896]|uniref:MerR family transcriptional regulator n=1 Tax=Cellulosimicrobium sp. CUA-896 TaxID=1517881 RepID=UPI000968521D|nr:MerR family transcriptional regulator [Cellulosimicrobium sp. CUA-896]OLT53158.1 MerR family transcriptional regulator [Cellulosimicrobium sp. CUA-896]